MNAAGEAPPRGDLVGGRRLAHNTLLTLVTGAVLLSASVVLVPFMLSAFGRELYGVLAITWMVLAHLGWLDFGLSRACARYVARELALDREDRATSWAWTALLSQTAFGVAGGAVLWLSAPLLADLLKAQEETRDLVVLALRLFALSVPLDLAARSLTGVLQAAQRFGWINGLNALLALATYAVYLAGVLRDGDFHLVIYGLLALRFLNLVALYAVAARILPRLRALPAVTPFASGFWPRLREMTGFGLWVAVAAMVGPLLLYFDQWMIGVLVGVAALPLYAIPLSIFSKLSILPSSLTQTLFPAFSSLGARNERARIEAYFVRAHRYLLAVLIPLFFVLFVWAPEILRLWISADFSSDASTVFRILVVGFGIALLAPLSGALLEGIGKPDLLAKLYLVELPLNLVLVVVLTRQFGITGAAVSYALRAAAETSVLWWIVGRAMSLSRSTLLLVRRTFGEIAAVLALLAVFAYVLREARIDDYYALAGTAAVLAAYLAYVALLLLDAQDRRFVRALVQRRASGQVAL